MGAAPWPQNAHGLERGGFEFDQAVVGNRWGLAAPLVRQILSSSPVVASRQQPLDRLAMQPGNREQDRDARLLEPAVDGREVAVGDAEVVAQDNRPGITPESESP